MTAPNIVNVTTITGKTAVLAATTAATAIVTNAAASGKVFKVNNLTIANINGTASATITVDIFRASVAYQLASTITVPADASLIVITKDSFVYLEEGDAIRLTSSINGYLSAVCSYEEIS